MRNERYRPIIEKCSPHRLLVGMGAAIVALLAAEMLLRIFYLGFSTAVLRQWRPRVPFERVRTLDPEKGSRPIPNARGRWPLHPWNASLEYGFDERGFRYEPLQARDAAPPACHVLVIGDSNAFGYGVASVDSYPSQLEALLEARGKPATVDNAGLIGSNITENVGWLREVLPRAQPTLVLLTVSPWSLRLDPPPSDPESHNFVEKLWRVFDLYALRWLTQNSALVDRVQRRLYHRMHDLAGWPPQSGVAWELDPLIEPQTKFEARWDAVVREIASIVRDIRREGVEVVLVFVPLDVQVSEQRYPLYREERLPYPSYGFVAWDYVGSDRYQRALSAATAELQMEIVDTTPALRARPADTFLPDDYHLSRAGNGVVAAAVVDDVARLCDRGVARQ